MTDTLPPPVLGHPRIILPAIGRPEILPHGVPRLVAADVELGKGVRIYAYANLYGCRIGYGTTIGAMVEIQNGATIGNRCKISSHTFICEGVSIEDEVFIGHNVTFINDVSPQAVTAEGQLQTSADWTCLPTLIKRGASIGSSATLMGGITVGEGAVIGAGAVVTRNVDPGVVVVGNPARFLRQRQNRQATSGKHEAKTAIAL
jgi:UDP-2-acetamido-3-amino-2,3-dideoxy-glucuronate N-acetyltransferase